MMRSFVLWFFVGLACASTGPAWKENTEYIYKVNGRTLSSLHEAADEYSGIFLKAQLHITSRTDGKLQCYISDPQYAKIQTQLPQGWQSEVPESQLSYNQLPLTQKPFQLVLENGLVKKMIVEKELTNWEANIIKSIVSQFQLDVQGQKAIRSSMTSLPRGNQIDGVFKTMEETVTGKTETQYDIHRLPEYLIQSQPWLVPQQSLRGDGEIIEVIKSKNYTNAEERPSYHYGFGEIEEHEPTSNKMGQFFIRESFSRAILTGKMSRFAVQNSYTVNKIMVNPIFKTKQMGSVISMVNVTLSEVKNQQAQPQDLSNPIEIGNLVYTFEKSFSKENLVHEKLSVSSKDEGSSEERSWGRFRRMASQWINKNSEESSSEEQEQQQRRPQLSQPHESPLLPSMMGYHGKSIRENKDFDIKQNVEKLVQEISEEMQEPERILKESTLNKYTILNTLIRLMNEQEIQSVAEQLYSQSERFQWIVFRDSVAESGTGPALLNIVQWIESKKIEKEEAAAVISTMAHAVRVPTEEYMRKFFETIKQSEVQRQHTLNETAILSFTDLVYRVYVSRNESHNQYPVHSFGRFYTKEGKEFVKKTVIPYLTEKLEESVQKSDARKIHFYIRALGNVGHRKILEAFEPYLEGQKQCSQFQRQWMVSCLDRLAQNKPLIARSVFYKIYQNVAEIPELRVVAVYQLMRTNPPTEMLQRMAQNTNTDVQRKVNAAVKSVIESATQLKSPGKQQLKHAAQAAKPLLTREEYGVDESYAFLLSSLEKEVGVEFHGDITTVGSDESDLPKGFGVKMATEMKGMKQHFSLKGMISSIRELTNVLYKQTEEYQNLKNQRSNDNDWSSASIAQMMNYERREREQLESVILSEMEHVQQMWSFDNQTIEQIPEILRKQEELFRNGKQFSYAKLRQLVEKALSFPTEMGLPFLYTYDMPLLIKTEGKVQAVATPQISRDNKLHKPEQITAEIEAHMTISGKDQSQVSFVTPFDHTIYMAGYDRNLQVHIPIKAKVEFDLKNKQIKMEMEVKEPHKDARLVHFSSYPFTSRSDLMTIRPVSARPNTRIIKREQNQHRHFDVEFGKKQTGLAFRVWGHHPEQTVTLGELYKTMMTGNPVEEIWNDVWDKLSLEYTEANIAYLPRQSTGRKVVLRYRFDQQYKKQPEQQQQQEFWTLNELSSKLQNMQQQEQRQQALMKHVGAGIQSAELRGSDLTVELESDKKYEHIMGWVSAKSNADPKSKVMFYYKNQQQDKQGLLEINGQVPNTNGLDLTESLRTEPTSQYTARAQYGSNEEIAQISGEFKLRRSSARKQFLIEQEPMYQVCKKQMQEGNFQLSACQNMTIRANFLDQMDLQLKYENLNRRFTQRFQEVYDAVRVYLYPMTQVNEVDEEGRNTISAKIDLQPETMRQVNLTIRHQGEETEFFNLSMPNQFVKAILLPHPVYHLSSRINAVLKGYRNIRPTCVVDKKQVETFMNKTYSQLLDEEYTVVMQYIPKDARKYGDERQSVERQLREQVENYVLLARQASSDQKELRLSFSHARTEGKTIQIELKPRQGQKSAQNPAATVIAEGQEMQFNDKQIADLYNGFVQIYALPNGEVKLEIQNAFYMIFDGERVKVTATSDKLRDSIRGLCGTFSEDKLEDFTVPQQCVVRSAEKFFKNYKVGSQERQQRGPECLSKVLPLYANVISDEDVGRTQERSGSTTEMRTRYVEEEDEICFTNVPVASCSGQPKETTTKNIGVHCIKATKTALHLKKQIDLGGNPDFSRKSQTKKIRMEIPVRCN